MGEGNQSKPNAFWKQPLQYTVIPCCRYLWTLFYILCTPKRFFMFALKKEITSYVDISDGHLSSLMKQPLTSYSYLSSSITLIILATGSSTNISWLPLPELSLSKVLFSTLGITVFFMVILIISSICMAIITRKFKYVTFFINYHCYNIGTMFFMLIAMFFILFPLLLLPSLFFTYDLNWISQVLLGKSEEPLVVQLIVGLVVWFPFFLVFLWPPYVCVVHPILIFHKVFRINIYCLVVYILLSWSIIMTVYGIFFKIFFKGIF